MKPACGPLTLVWILGIWICTVTSLTAQVRTPEADTALTAIDSQLTAELEQLARQQKDYKRSHPTYAASAAMLGTDNERTVMLAANQSGWSAVATDTLAPGFLCFYHHGEADVPLRAGQRKDRVFCRGEPDTVIVEPPDSISFAQALRLSDPPQPNDCRQWTGNIRNSRRGTRKGDGRAVLVFIVDTTGTIEAADIRILEATDIEMVVDLLYIISNCGFTPGNVHGTPVRVLVQQAYNFVR